MKYNRWKIFTFVLLGGFFLLLVIYFIAAPFLMVSNMQQAIINRDAETFCSYIDFPRLRENLKAEFNAKMLDEMRKNPQGAGLGMAIAPAMINNMVDSFVTPQAFERLMKSESAPTPQDQQNPFKNKLIDESKVDLSIGYSSFNRFEIVTTDKVDRSKGANLIFERQGIFTWRLVEMKIK